MTDGIKEIDHEAERASEFRSYVGLALAAVLVALAVWMVTSFRAHNRLIECYETGHHDCQPLDTSGRG